MLDHEHDEPLSPELVLVSPELRERVSSEEPEPAAAPGAPEDVAPQPAAPSPPPMPSAPPAPPVPPAAARPAASPLLPPSTQTTEARVEWRLTVGAATVLALCAALVFGAGVAVGQLALPTSTSQPETSPVSSQERPSTAPVPTSPTSPRASVPEAPVPSSVLPIPTSVPAATVAQKPKPTPIPARPAKRASKTVRPVPNGGYAFFDGSLQVSGDGRGIARFMVRTNCAGPLVLKTIRVTPAGTFAFSGHPAGSLPGTTVRLTGRFVSQARARGTLQVTRTTCHDTATPFVAHLS